MLISMSDYRHASARQEEKCMLLGRGISNIDGVNIMQNSIGSSNEVEAKNVGDDAG